MLIGLCIGLLTLPGFSQNQLPVYEADSYSFPDLSQEAQDELARQYELLEKYDALNPKEKAELEGLLERYGETYTDIWSIDNGGCSWYCGGGNYKIEASSSLGSQGKNTYAPASANDLSYQTAWVEGKEGDGIGEYLEYHFKNNSPRITSVIVSNGYMKSDYAWENNNRVKALKFYVNGEAMGILKLSDTKSDQEFKLGTFGHNADGSDLVLRFEILEVYKGKKYSDTAISEIYFDGIDVH